MESLNCRGVSDAAVGAHSKVTALCTSATVRHSDVDYLPVASLLRYDVADKSAARGTPREKSLVS